VQAILPEQENEMNKYQVSANGAVFGIYKAKDEQGARNACARDAGYKSEVDMVKKLEQPSELIAELVEE
jgi:hypothetical protein